MTLKQEFLDMVSLLNPNITADSYDENYTIDKNFVMTVCEESGEDISYYCCSDCKYDSDDCNCECKIYQEVDVYLWSKEGYGTGYVFGKSAKDFKMFKNIRCINNRKQLWKEMEMLKQEFEADRNGYADYAKRVLEYKKYIEVFLDEVIKDFSVFGNIKKDIIPVVFDKDYRKDYDFEKKTFTKGDFQNVGVQSVIHIYDSWSMNIEDMKKTIRHEILHYLLWCIAPLGNINSDDSGIFHYFCHVYDAGAYKEMDNENAKAYEALKERSKKEVNEILIQLFNKKPSE